MGIEHRLYEGRMNNMGQIISLCGSWVIKGSEWESPFWDSLCPLDSLSRCFPDAFECGIPPNAKFCEDNSGFNTWNKKEEKCRNSDHLSTFIVEGKNLYTIHFTVNWLLCLPFQIAIIEWNFFQYNQMFDQHKWWDRLYVMAPYKLLSTVVVVSVQSGDIFHSWNEELEYSQIDRLSMKTNPN